MGDVDDLTDDLLELILLRVDSHACLLRAAATCKQWCRVVTEAHFIRRFRSLHGPVVAGYYFNRVRSNAPRSEPTSRPAFEPSSSTLPAIDARHFSLDFLSDMTTEFHQATILDSRGSLLLMEFKGPNTTTVPKAFPVVLVVCEPSTRRYTRIPPPSCDFSDVNCLYHRSYLIDGVADEAVGCISMSNFRVLWELCRGGVAHATVIAAAGGSKHSWTEKAINDMVPRVDFRRRILGRAGGSWYFYLNGMTTGIVLDGHTGEYSPFLLPTCTDWDVHSMWGYDFSVTDGHDGKLRILSLLDTTMKVFTRLNAPNDEWALEKKILLVEPACEFLDYEPSFLMPKCRRNEWAFIMWMKGPGFVTLLLQQAGKQSFFSIDLDTMKVKPTMEDMCDMVFQYELPWPPVALHACLDR